MKESGIYLITCKPTGKVYVGQSTGRTGVAGRLKEHKRALKWGRDSVHLQRAWDKYGEDAFSFEEESRLLDPLIWKSGRKPLNPRKRCPPYE